MGVGLIVAVQKVIGNVKLKFDKEIQLYERRTAVCVFLRWLRCDVVLGVVMKLENTADRDISNSERGRIICELCENNFL